MHWSKCANSSTCSSFLIVQVGLLDLIYIIALDVLIEPHSYSNSFQQSHWLNFIGCFNGFDWST